MVTTWTPALVWWWPIRPVPESVWTLTGLRTKQEESKEMKRIFIIKVSGQEVLEAKDSTEALKLALEGLGNAPPWMSFDVYEVSGSQG